MNKLEAEFTTKAKSWILETLPTCLWEVKHTRGKSTFNMSELKEHQKNWLLASTTKKGVNYKMPDAGFGFNPCDGFNIKGERAFVIICFPTWVTAIEIKVLLLLNHTSITEERARRISVFSIQTKDI